MTARQIEELIKAQQKRQRSTSKLKWLAQDYMRDELEGVIYLNVSVPEVRKVLAKILDQLDLSDFQEGFTFFDKILKTSKVFEVRSLAFYWLAAQQTATLVDNKKLVLKWIESVTNWAHSDCFSSVLARIHEMQSLSAVFKKWNQSPNPWKRRNSIVGLYYYSRLRKHRYPDYEESRRLVDSLIQDSHYYVQKGVGWTLREMFNVDPVKTYSFLKKRAKQIPPAAWFAAQENLNRAQKKELMKIRKSRKAILEKE